MLALKSLSTILILSILLSACAQPTSTPHAVPNPSETAKPTDPAVIPPKSVGTASPDQESKVPTTPSESSIDPLTNPTEQTIIPFVASANARYGYLLSGGDYSSLGDGAPLPTFRHGNSEYRHLGEDLDTRTELNAYLGKVYSADAIASTYDSLNIIEIDGRLAQPNADGGSLLDFPNATAQLIKKTDVTASFELKVPVGATTEFAPVIVDFVYDPSSKAWFLDTPPNQLH